MQWQQMPSCRTGLKGVCQPTLESDRSGTVQSPNGQGTYCSGGTSLEDTTMVPPTIANANCNTTSDQSRSDKDPEDLVHQLAAWHISGRDTETKRKLPHSCSGPGRLRPTSLTTHSPASGIAGVVQGVRIPFLAL